FLERQAQGSVAGARLLQARGRLGAAAGAPGVLAAGGEKGIAWLDGFRSGLERIENVDTERELRRVVLLREEGRCAEQAGGDVLAVVGLAPEVDELGVGRARRVRLSLQRGVGAFRPE